MNVFAVAGKHVGFRNIIAHSPLIITGHEDGSKHIHGILNLTPNDDKQAGELWLNFVDASRNRQSWGRSCYKCKPTT